MALSIEEINLINRAMNASKVIQEQLLPFLQELNSVWNASGGPASTIVQGDLDAVSAYSGLTTTQLTNGMYALTATILGDINSTEAALAQLAARGTQATLTQ